MEPCRQLGYIMTTRRGKSISVELPLNKTSPKAEPKLKNMISLVNIGLLALTLAFCVSIVGHPTSQQYNSLFCNKYLLEQQSVQEESESGLGGLFSQT